ncbi:MAG: YqgE/AlgH family protein [Acidimicrobiales bacterium]|nr:YqgE/AlgH family protein [Acidimicrobiales bacterium]
MAARPGELEPAEGRILVASPVIGDDTFFRTVVLLLEHEHDAGTLGVVLNRPTELTVGEAIPAWGDNLTPPDMLFTGGPVAEGSALGLALVERAGPPPAGLTTVFDRLAVVDLETDPTVLAASVERLRIYSGYAGWGPGQLRGELRAGAWWVFESRPEDWFSSEPDELWSAVLRRQGGRWKMWAAAPLDPRVN